MALVGIVLVSHSPSLAEGVRDLLRQVATDEVRVEPAAGTDDGSLGTSFTKISEAVGRADTGASAERARTHASVAPRIDILQECAGRRSARAMPEGEAVSDKREAPTKDR